MKHRQALVIPSAEITADAIRGVRQDLAIASSAAQYTFGSVNGVAISGTGEIFVLDRLGRTIDVFDRAGSFRRRIGRAGQGPGEFKWPSAIAMRNDTLFVLDETLMVLRPDGKEISRYHSDIADFDLRLGRTITPVPNGVAFVAYIRQRAGAVTGVDTTLVRIFDTSAQTIGPVLARSPAPTMSYYPNGPIGSYPQSVNSPIAVAMNGTIYRAVGDSFHIEIRFPSGDTQEILARVARIPTTKRDKDDNYQSATMELLSYPENARSIDLDRWKRAFYSAPAPDNRPVIGSLIAAPNGSLLIKRLDISARPFADFDSTAHALWLLLDSTFAPRGHVTLPVRFKAYEFSGCAVSGIMKDDDGVGSVRRYSIDPDGPGGKLSCGTAGSNN